MQITTTIERQVSKAHHAVGDGDRGQAGAISERVIVNIGNAFINDNARKALAVVERSIRQVYVGNSNRSQTIRNVVSYIITRCIILLC